MSELTEANVENIIVTCGENTAALAESFNQCFDRNYRFELGESLPFDAAQLPAEFDGPGLAVSFQVGELHLTCLIPNSLPLPEWYTTPNDSETSRLQTLAMEWPMNMLPEDFEAGEFATVAVTNLKEAALAANPAEWAAALELLLFDEATTDEATTTEAATAESSDGTETNETEQADSDGETDEENKDTADSDEATDSETTDSESAEAAAEADNTADSESPTINASEPVAKLLLIWPVASMPVGNVEAAPEPAAAATTEAPESSQPAEQTAAAAQTSSLQVSDRTRRIMKMPVKVIVRLAEKKIEMGQLLSISPGALITFNKPCEELLDLYINNHKYCRGEAIKIGEKFGLKISEVGVVDIRELQIIE